MLQAMGLNHAPPDQEVKTQTSPPPKPCFQAHVNGTPPPQPWWVVPMQKFVGGSGFDKMVNVKNLSLSPMGCTNAEMLIKGFGYRLNCRGVAKFGYTLLSHPGLYQCRCPRGVCRGVVYLGACITAHGVWGHT